MLKIETEGEYFRLSWKYPYSSLIPVNPLNFAAIKFCVFEASKFHCYLNLQFSNFTRYIIILSKYIHEYKFSRFNNNAKFVKINRKFPVLQYLYFNNIDNATNVNLIFVLPTEVTAWYAGAGLPHH